MRALLAIVFWWVVLAGVWLLYVGQHTKENAVAGGDDADAADELGGDRRPDEDVDGDLVDAHTRRSMKRAKTKPLTSEIPARTSGTVV